MAKIHTLIFSIVIFCLAPALTGASVSTYDPGTNLNNLPAEAPVARVLERTVTLGDINPSQDMIDKYGTDKTAEQLEEWKAQHRKSNLGRYFQSLFDRYAEQSEITVTETAIEQFNRAILRSSEQQLNKEKTMTVSLEKELRAKNLDDAVRDELTEELEMYTRSIKYSEEGKDSFQGSGNTVAGTMIRQWKINQHLYKQYGGRVIYQQAGPEPLDAYRKFLEERQQQGDFEFYNNEASDLFWEYFRNEKMHLFISDADEAKRMMETPWWLQAPEETLYPADMDLWGDCTDGLCLKINPKRGVFTTDKDVTVTVDLLNIGQTTYRVSSPEQFFEVEVDGKWYDWNGPEASDILSAFVETDTVQYGFATLMLTGQWHSIEDNEPLALDGGTHYLRVRYRPMGIRLESDAGLQGIPPTFWVTSNLQTFEIIEQTLTIFEQLKSR